MRARSGPVAGVLSFDEMVRRARSVSVSAVALYQSFPHPDIESPVLVVCMEGWVDAGLGAATATATLLGTIPTEVAAVFDTNELIDQRARRPVMHVKDGINTGLTWPQIELRVGEDAAGKAVAVLVGPEPDLRWRTFINAVAELAGSLGVRLAVGLGAFPSPAPHTRPVRLISTATSPDLASLMGSIEGTLDVPAGIESAMELGLAEAGIPAMGLWARVPHYVAGMPYPAASAALLDSLALVAGLQVDSTDLWGAAELTRQKVDELIGQSDAHTAMVRQLEEQVDTTEGASLGLGQIPSGDEIGDELERYLRGEQGPG